MYKHGFTRKFRYRSIFDSNRFDFTENSVLFRARPYLVFIHLPPADHGPTPSPENDKRSHWIIRTPVVACRTVTGPAAVFWAFETVVWPSGVPPRGGRTYVTCAAAAAEAASCRAGIPCAARRENATVLGARGGASSVAPVSNVSLRLAGSSLSRPAPPPPALPVPVLGWSAAAARRRAGCG